MRPLLTGALERDLLSEEHAFHRAGWGTWVLDLPSVNVTRTREDVPLQTPDKVDQAVKLEERHLANLEGSAHTAIMWTP